MEMAARARGFNKEFDSRRSMSMADVMADAVDPRDQRIAELSAELNSWKHYASFIANAAPAGVPSFAEWKAKQGGAG